MKSVKNALKITALLALMTSQALAFKEAAYKGFTDNKSTGYFDSMALIVKKDTSVQYANTDTYLAVLAEYEQLPLTNFIRKAAITSWIPRLYAFRLKPISDLEYKVTPLYVDNSGEIAEMEKAYSTLTLEKKSEFKNAVLYRRDLNSGRISETITFNGNKHTSTWEPFVTGNFFGTAEASGTDYLNKEINTKLYKYNDGTYGGDFDTDLVKGKFKIVASKTAPGFFTFVAKENVQLDKSQLSQQIGVFIDIVNWKHINFTTNELLTIHPESGTDLGFYYERK